MKPRIKNFRIVLLSLMVTINFGAWKLIQPHPHTEIIQIEDVFAQSGSTYTVDRITDAQPEDGGEGSGLTGDLRYAITNAQSGDTIIFGITGEVLLSRALPLLTQDISIRGPNPGNLTIRGNGTGSIFSIWNDTKVVLSNLTITGGLGNGGGIFNRGVLTLNNVTVSGNRAGDPTNGGGTGAGIWNYINATLILNNCTISNNSVFGSSSYNPSRGGGIANYGTLTLNNSTVSGNSASDGAGGGISNTLSASNLTLHNSTVSGNSTDGVSGIASGIDNRGTLTMINSIIAGNTQDDMRGALTSLGHNLIGNTTGGRGFRPDLGDLLDVNPLLGSLGNNGGITQTHALLAGSPAIDSGDTIACPQFDQRGQVRPADGDGNGIAICDMGAYETSASLPLTGTPTLASTLTPTITISPSATDTPSLTSSLEPTFTDTPTPIPVITPTSTPAPPIRPCSGAIILVAMIFLLYRTTRILP